MSMEAIYTLCIDSFFLSAPSFAASTWRSQGAQGALKFTCSARRFSPTRWSGRRGRGKRIARCRRQTKRGNCMKNRLSLLAVRGRGFRRSCSRSPSEELRKWQTRGYEKKGEREKKKIEKKIEDRARCRNKCVESDVKGSALSSSRRLFIFLCVVPLFSLIVYTSWRCV